ncbi:MAG: N-acetylneuraminate synthase family protein, partial [Candidatus Omnitrophota bacterium]
MHKKVYIIAEVGVNHNGKLQNCFKLIEAAAGAGCDCVKFQFFKANRLYSPLSGKLKWRTKNDTFSYDIYEAARTVQMPDAWVRPLMGCCRAHKIECLFSVFDSRSLAFLLRQRCKKINLPS